MLRNEVFEIKSKMTLVNILINHLRIDTSGGGVNFGALFY